MVRFIKLGDRKFSSEGTLLSKLNTSESVRPGSEAILMRCSIFNPEVNGERKGVQDGPLTDRQ